MQLLSNEDKEEAAKILWMAAFEETIKACRQADLGSDATLVGIITTMTTVLRELFSDVRKEAQ